MPKKIEKYITESFDSLTEAVAWANQMAKSGYRLHTVYRYNDVYAVLELQND